MKLNNKIMLITYADSMGRNLKELHTVLNTCYREAVGGVHILPFFPSSADRGFAPMRYDVVDEKFGDFSDVEAIGKEYYLMFDFMVNHISASSEYFQDFLEKKDASPYKDFFIRYKEFWKNGEPTQEQIDKIYKRKPRAPFIEAEFKDGTKEKVWCTFCEEQIDLDVTKEATKRFIKETLKFLCEKGASIIRLDAFAYAVKKEDTSCFFVEPDIWELLHEIEKTVAENGAEILPEIHEHYTIPMKIARQGFWIYDFALPVLTLHALYNHTGKYLKKWMEMCPMKQFTTLDNSALGNHDAAYLLARAIQFFAPGIPQVYYVGLLAGENDLELMEQTKNGRDINRHYYSLEEIKEQQKRPVVQKLKELMVLRNTDPAFHLDGKIEIEANEDKLIITRSYGTNSITLKADLSSYMFEIIRNGEERK